MVDSDSYYDVLGVPSASAPDVIRAKYRKLIRCVHPDLDGPVALFHQVQEAYEVLSDPVRRAAYDRWLEARIRTRLGFGSVNQSRQTSSYRLLPRQPGSRPARAVAPFPSRSSAVQVPNRVTRKELAGSFVRNYPARVGAIAGAALLVLGAVLGSIGLGPLVLGVVVLVVATLAGLGARRDWSKTQGSPRALLPHQGLTSRPARRRG
jgi:curved DNA-binding protein CbpA